jgi:hypothetical protein
VIVGGILASQEVVGKTANCAVCDIAHRLQMVQSVI